MTQKALEDLVGTTILTDYRLDALVRLDDVLVVYGATCVTDGSACTVRIAQCLDVGAHQCASVQVALTRIGRHAAGIRGLAPPRAAGIVELDQRRRLAVAHGGEPTPSAEGRITSGVPASLDEALALIEPIAQALGALHDQGIVHGAIHPAAVRFHSVGSTLSAFGLSELAGVIGGPTAARDVVPSRSRTPEQVGVVPASPSPESDTYAIAMLFVELVAGRPFMDEIDPQTIAARIDHPVSRPTPRNLGLDVSEAVEAVFARALQRGTRQRTSDPRAFVRDLSAARWEKGLAGHPRQEPADPVQMVEAPQAPLVRMTSGAGFEPPPRPAARARKPSHFYPPPPPNPSKSKSNAWLVYVLVGLGALLLLGGVGTVFAYVMQAHPSPTSATTTAAPPPPVAPPPKTTPSPTTVPPPSTEPHLFDAGTDAPAEAGPRTWARADGGSFIHPDDTMALIPISKDSALVGSPNALVTVVVFVDMKCPYTKRARPALERLLDVYDSDMRVAVRHLPLSEHPGAEQSAEAAAGTYAIGGPGAFWHVFERMTENQSSHTRDKLLGWASEAGVTEAKLGGALDSHAYEPIVRRDIQLAGQLMVRATPTFFINGRRLDGMQSQSALTNVIESERLAARAALDSGTKPAAIYAARVKFNVTSADADRPR